MYYENMSLKFPLDEPNDAFSVTSDSCSDLLQKYYQGTPAYRSKASITIDLLSVYTDVEYSSDIDYSGCNDDFSTMKNYFNMDNSDFKQSYINTIYSSKPIGYSTDGLYSYNPIYVIYEKHILLYLVTCPNFVHFGDFIHQVFWEFNNEVFTDDADVMFYVANCKDVDIYDNKKSLAQSIRESFKDCSLYSSYDDSANIQFARAETPKAFFQKRYGTWKT